MAKGDKKYLGDSVYVATNGATRHPLEERARNLGAKGEAVSATIPDGDLYDCRDVEHLICTTPEEALEDFLDLWMTPDCDVAALIREHSPVELVVYRRAEVTPAWIRGETERILEVVEEDWGEAFGDPDGSGANDLGEAAREQALPLFEAAIRQFIGQGVVWSCECVGKVLLDAEQVEAMMREARPDLFEPDPTRKGGE